MLTMLTISNERLAKLFPAIHPRNKASLAFVISQSNEMCFFVYIEESVVITSLDPDAIFGYENTKNWKKCI